MYNMYLKTGNFKSMRKALTVGELLITMAIIGVIAMLVLPGFLKDYHNRLYTTRLKKSYEQISDALERASIDSNVSYFAQTKYITNTQEFLQNYFKVSKKIAGAAFADSYRTISNVENNDGESITSNISGATIKLQGGETISMDCESISICTILLDINAADGPNVGGRDLFTFKINAAKNEIYDGNTAATCGTDKLGTGCLQKIINDNWKMTY